MFVLTIIWAAVFAFISDIIYKYITHDNVKKISPKFIAITCAAEIVGVIFLNAAKLLTFDFGKIINAPFLDNFFYCIIISLALIYIVLNINTKKNPDIKIRKFLKTVCLFLAIAFLLEFFVFNFRHYELLTGNYETTSYSLSDTTKLNFTQNENGYLSVADDTQASIEIKNINKELKNIFIDVEYMSKENITVQIMMTDESNSQYFYSPTQELVNSIKKSNYLPLYLNGKSHDIKILFTGQPQYNIGINSITFNTARDIDFVFARFLLAFSILLLIYYLRPKSKLYNLTYNKKDKNQKIAIACVLTVQIVLLFFVARTSIDPLNQPTDYYQDLAVRLLDGHVDMSATPPDELAALDNPYDSSQRTQSYLWDMSYYNGHYYFYYGVVPAVLLYAPYHALTGGHLSTYVAVFIFAVGAAFALFGILRTLIEKYFKKIPFVIFLMSSTLVINSCLILDLLRRPKFYEVMEMSGLFFVTAGLYFWLNSIWTHDANIKGKTLIKNKLSKGKLALGSLCMALAVGCRPSLLFVSLLAFPIFGSYVYENFGLKEKRLNLSKSNLSSLASFCVPFVIVGILLMLYNYAKYKSPFNFGINYQLTMVHTIEFKITYFQKLFEQMISYLFNPPTLSLKFPYIAEGYVRNVTFMGKVAIITRVIGAAFNFILLVLLLTPNMKRFLSEKLRNNDRKLLTRTVWFLLGIGFILLASIILKGGVVRRYMVDVMWLWLVAAMIIFYAVYEYSQKSKLLFFVKRFFIFCFVTGMIINLCVTVTGENNNFYIYNPNLYNKVEYLFSFWL